MQYKKVTHVLFDLDGLLIDSEKLYTEAFETVCAKYGKIFTWELKSSLLGFQGSECAEKIINNLNLPLTKDDFMNECQKVYEKIFIDVQLMPGAQKIVEHLYRKGVPLALATSSSQNSIDMKMQNHKSFLKYFHHLTMGSSDPEVTKGKPDPIIFLVCASRFPDNPKPEDKHKKTLNTHGCVGLLIQQEVLKQHNGISSALIACLVFEDAVNGVKAACAANMQVVAVPDPRIDREQLKNATLVLNSLEDFKPELFGLPSYD